MSKKEWTFEGVSLEHCYAPKRKSLEAIIHTIVSLWKARKYKPDIVHIHAAACLLTPMAKLLGYKTVVTSHGPEYDRQKWGIIAKLTIRLGEKFAGFFADEIIVISAVIEDIIKRHCNRRSNVIFNGVNLPELKSIHNCLDQFGGSTEKLYSRSARIVPEKGIHDLITAFNSVDQDIQLVIAGDADHESAYSRRIKNMAAKDPRVVMTGYITGEPLKQLYTHARYVCSAVLS